MKNQIILNHVIDYETFQKYQLYWKFFAEVNHVRYIRIGEKLKLCTDSVSFSPYKVYKVEKIPNRFLP